MAKSGTELERAKAELVLYNTEDLLHDHEYEEMKTQMMFKQQCRHYNKTARLSRFDFSL
jgi:hypothetical protein